MVMLLLKILLDIISLIFLEVYGLVYLTIAEKMKHQSIVKLEYLFVAIGVTMVVLSYLYHSSTSLVIGSLLFSIPLIRIVLIKWKKKLVRILGGLLIDKMKEKYIDGGVNIW